MLLASVLDVIPHHFRSYVTGLSFFLDGPAGRDRPWRPAGAPLRGFSGGWRGRGVPCGSIACRRAGAMPGLWRLVAAPGTSPGGQAYGNAGAELAAQAVGISGLAKLVCITGTAMQNCVTNESSLTQYRKKRKISDAPDETAMTHRTGVATESRGCGWAKRKSSDLPHSALHLRPG